LKMDPIEGSETSYKPDAGDTPKNLNS
jgi:hypothetical protein